VSCGALNRVVAAIAAAEVAATHCVSLTETRPPRPWEPSPVTLLGDAVHAVNPTTGSGAKLALLDASILAAELATGAHPAEAIGAYERRMLAFAFKRGANRG
jgi:2-polyprenyl-6-methoxyphenol hydroxylase-like FAD-dependent oxidoreductase